MHAKKQTLASPAKRKKHVDSEKMLQQSREEEGGKKKKEKKKRLFVSVSPVCRSPFRLREHRVCSAVLQQGNVDKHKETKKTKRRTAQLEKGSCFQCAVAPTHRKSAAPHDNNFV